MATATRPFGGPTSAVVFEELLSTDADAGSTAEREDPCRSRARHRTAARERSRDTLPVGRRRARRSETSRSRHRRRSAGDVSHSRTGVRINTEKDCSSPWRARWRWSRRWQCCGGSHNLARQRSASPSEYVQLTELLRLGHRSQSLARRSNGHVHPIRLGVPLDRRRLREIALGGRCRAPHQRRGPTLRAGVHP